MYLLLVHVQSPKEENQSCSWRRPKLISILGINVNHFQVLNLSEGHQVKIKFTFASTKIHLFTY